MFLRTKSTPVLDNEQTVYSFPLKSLSTFVVINPLAFNNRKTTEKLLANPLSETDGLQPYELSLLAFIVGEQCTDEEVAPIYELKNMMNKAGFNNTAFSIGIRLLNVCFYFLDNFFS